MKSRKLYIAAAMLAVSLASNAQTTPTYEEMPGDYVILNYMSYDDVVYLKETRAFNVKHSSEADKLWFTNFYMLTGSAFECTYRSNGTVMIDAGTLMFEFPDGQGSKQWLFNWDEANSEPNERPIYYRYEGDNRWLCGSPLVLVTGTSLDSEELYPYYFAVESEFMRSNANTHNVSYVWDNYDNRNQVWDENRASYVEVLDNGKTINVYNLLAISSQLYGCWIRLTKNESTGLYTAVPYIMADASTNFEWPYKTLAGVEYNSSTMRPTGPVNKGGKNEGLITATVDFDNGKIIFNPVCILPSKYDENGYVINYDSYYEFVQTLEIDFDASSLSSVDEMKIDPAAALVATEYYTLSGIRVANPDKGMLLVRRMVMSDGSIRSDKIKF